MARVTLVTGGVKSGKSAYVVEQAAHCGPDVLFVATCRPGDDAGMLDRVERHRAERPSSWETLEVAEDVGSVLSADRDAAVVDCLNLLVSQMLVRGASEAEIHDRVDAFVSAAPCRLFVVTNEVGSGVHPHGELALRFVDVLGRVNQRAARAADDVILLVAGIPLAVKGEIG